MSEVFQPYCAQCDQDVDCYFKEQPYTHNIHGKDYTIMAQHAYCSTCHAQVFHNHAHDYNLTALYLQYRLEHGIVTLREIREICTRYNIGTESLSQLLEWEEMLFTRYYNSRTPSPEHSAILLRIRHEPSYFLELLTTKQHLISPVAYRKAHATVQALLNQTPETKLWYAALYLLHQNQQLCPSMSQRRLQLYLYYAQGFSLGIFGRPLFIEDCLRGTYGPHFASITTRLSQVDNALYKGNVPELLQPLPADLHDYLDTHELQLLDAIRENFQVWSSVQLRKFVEQEEPWQQSVRDDTPHLTPASMEQYFSHQKFVRGFFEPANLDNYVHEQLKAVLQSNSRKYSADAQDKKIAQA